MRRVPAILSDIDGVLYRGSKLIPGSDKALRTLLTCHCDGAPEWLNNDFLKREVASIFDEGQSFTLPFTLLTNGGGVPEFDRAEVVNRIVFNETLYERVYSQRAKDAALSLLSRDPKKIFDMLREGAKLAYDIDQEHSFERDTGLVESKHMIECHTPLKGLVPKYADEYVLITGNKEVLQVSQNYGFKKAIHAEELFSLMPELSPLTQKCYPPSLMEEKKAQFDHLILPYL